MAWQTSALVIANRTVDSDQLLEALEGRARSGPVRFTLLVPCGPTGRDGARERLEAARRRMGPGGPGGGGPPGRDGARERLEAACSRMRQAGLEVDGTLARDSEPLAAAHQAWDPAKY